MWNNFDIFYQERQQFEWDVHILILGALQAALDTFSEAADKELANIESYINKPNVDHERLVDEHVDVLAIHSERVTFLRNAALVSLTARLNVVLKRMASHAESFSPRKPGRYVGRHGKGEFGRFWNEYEERFGLDFESEAGRIAFVEPMLMARNQIVHEGGEACLIRPDGTLNTGFSDAHPQYVQFAGGLNASVAVSEDLLEENIERSIALVKWISERLRALQVRAKPPA